MKALHFFLIVAISGTFMASGCKKDNYDPPAAQLTGRMVHQGEPLQLHHGQCTYQLFQDGFGARGPVTNTTVAHDGSFSVLLFDGSYKFTINDNQAPYMWQTGGNGRPDTIIVDVKGNTTVDISVTPYYLVRNAQVTNAGRQVTGRFGVEKIAGNRDVEYVQLFVNRTEFVGQPANYNLNPTSGENTGRLAGASIGDMGNVQLTMQIPEEPNKPIQNFYFARVGLKVANIEKLIYSPVFRVNL